MPTSIGPSLDQMRFLHNDINTHHKNEPTEHGFEFSFDILFESALPAIIPTTATAEHVNRNFQSIT